MLNNANLTTKSCQALFIAASCGIRSNKAISNNTSDVLNIALI